MKYKNTVPYYPALLLLFLLAGCSPSFRAGYRKYQEQDYTAARPVFERFREHPKYASAARYFLEKMRLADTRDLTGLLQIDSALAISDSLFRRLPGKKAQRLTHNFSVDTLALLDLREQTQRWAIAGTKARGTLPALDSLLLGLSNPVPRVQPDIRSARTDIVNAHLRTTDYDTMTAILKRHLEFVLPENLDQTRRMSETAWTAFLEKYTPCQLNRFAGDYRLSFAARDCWRMQVRELLCTGKLSDLLNFHAENRWSALEIVLLNTIADRTADNTAVAGLNPEQAKHLLDLRRRAALRTQLQNGTAADDTTATLEQAVGYIARYAPRYSAFRLMEEGFQFFIDRKHYHSAITLLEQARPHFPDTLPSDCNTNFDYQRRVRPWIDGKLPILRRPERVATKQPLATLNTAQGEEFSPVVRADGREIFFAGKNRPDNIAGADIFTATWNEIRQDWNAPILVQNLSGTGNTVPLSITADGRLLLLKANNRLHTSRRAAPDSAWSAPEPLAVSGIAILGDGCLSADGNTLILEGAYSAGSATQAPDLDLFISRRDPATGQWSTPAALGADINTDGQETAPYLMPDGKTLFYVSTGYPGLGQGDVFVAHRTRDDWTHWTYPENLGKELNDTRPHSGFTTVSPDGKRAWGGADRDLFVVEVAGRLTQN
ncbi:MAG: PD40 domain-containing protein [Saprospiraceae bacterium]|jgi:hypothetical protein|nr:PD40 domain-containing protein [Saprospiraceae bacterium]